MGPLGWGIIGYLLGRSDSGPQYVVQISAEEAMRRNREQGAVIVIVFLVIVGFCGVVWWNAPIKPVNVGTKEETGGVHAATIAEYKKLGARFYINQIAGIPTPTFEFRDFQKGKLPAIQVPFALDLSHSNVTDTDLKEVASLKNLTWLYLFGTKITDAGLKELAVLKDIRIIDLASCHNLTASGVEKLKKAIPACYIPGF